MAVARENGKKIFGDGEDVSPRLVGKEILEHADFMRAGDMALSDERGISLFQASLSLLASAKEFDSDPTLAGVWFWDERQWKNFRSGFEAERLGQKN